jgi:hypothetical protein
VSEVVVNDVFALTMFIITITIVALLAALMLLEYLIEHGPAMRRYVQSARVPFQSVPVPARSNAMEPEPEREPAPEPAQEPLERTARDTAVAEALGLLLARGLVTDRVEAMELLFGPRGRRWQAVRPLLDKAVQDATPPPAVTPLAGRPIPPGVKFEEPRPEEA